MSENTIGTAYVQIEPSFDGVTPKIEKEFGGEGKKAGSKFGAGFASTMGTTAKVLGGALVGGTTMVAGFVQQATAAFGSYQQLKGGVETLFGNGGAAMDEYMKTAKEAGMTASEALDSFMSKDKAQAEVLKNASIAYKTAGLDANQYMETVTSFSASLLQSVGGDSLKAAKTADMAIIDMSDNANKMGTSMESIQNAYQGFAKQNYTMLDNLNTMGALVA